jgi:hypothetical protein
MNAASDITRARRGKIARLPLKLREEICHRLLEGQPARKLLPWLNALPEVQAVLQSEFNGEPVSEMNLSAWRNGGFQEWLTRRERIERTRELAAYAARQAKAGGASIAEGAQAIASGKLLELLETLDEVIEQKIGENDGAGDRQQLSAEALVSIASALSALRTSEQNDVRLAQNEKKLAQKDAELSLAREKFQRDTAELFIKWHRDQRALDIVNSEDDKSAMMQKLGQLMFPDTWKPATE